MAGFGAPRGPGDTRRIELALQRRQVLPDQALQCPDLLGELLLAVPAQPLLVGRRQGGRGLDVGVQRSDQLGESGRAPLLGPAAGVLLPVDCPSDLRQGVVDLREPGIDGTGNVGLRLERPAHPTESLLDLPARRQNRVHDAHQVVERL